MRKNIGRYIGPAREGSGAAHLLVCALGLADGQCTGVAYHVVEPKGVGFISTHRRGEGTSVITLDLSRGYLAVAESFSDNFWQRWKCAQQARIARVG